MIFLSKYLFDDEDIKIISNTKVILDIKVIETERRSQELSPDIYAVITFPKYMEAVKSLSVPFIDVICDNVIANQHKKFINMLAKTLKKESDKELKEVDPREIFN